MRNGNQKAWGALFLAIFCLCAAVAGEKKLIHCGWDIATPKYLRENIELMERAPYDGVSIAFNSGKTDRPGMFANRYTAFTDWRWKKEWFADAIADLKATKFRKFTDNFILVTTNPGNARMTDDSTWESIAHNLGLLAGIARECGLKGIIFDPEFYQEKVFQYNPESGVPFGEMKQLARRRGRQMVAAMAEQYPDMTLINFFLLVKMTDMIDERQPEISLQESDYALFPSFVDGMLDAAPETFTLVDGCEEAYEAGNETDYLRLLWKMRTRSPQLLSPENRDRYTRVQAGFGLWLDPYITFHLDRENQLRYFRQHRKFLLAPAGTTQLEMLRDNLGYALKYSDGYVWDWAEYGKWWPRELPEWQKKRSEETPMTGRLWSEIDPGIPAAYEAARRSALPPEKLPAFAEDKFEILRSFSFDEGSGFAPWSFWQTAKSKENGGSADLAAGGLDGNRAVRLNRCLHGCLTLKQPVEPGQVYAVRAYAKGPGARLEIHWKNAAGEEYAPEFSRRLAFTAPASDGWKSAVAVFSAPEGATNADLVLFSRNGEGSTFFDKVTVYRRKGN